MTTDNVISLIVLVFTIAGSVLSLAAYVGGKVDGLRDDMREDVKELGERLTDAVKIIAAHDPKISANAAGVASNTGRLNSHSARLRELELQRQV